MPMVAMYTHAGLEAEDSACLTLSPAPGLCAIANQLRSAQWEVPPGGMRCCWMQKLLFGMPSAHKASM